MATLNTTNIKHGSSSSNNIVLASDGSTTISNLSNDVGKILQVVQTTKTDSFSYTTTNTEFDITGMSATITPSASTSKILVTASINYGGSVNTYCGIILKDNSSGSFTYTSRADSFTASNGASVPRYTTTADTINPYKVTNTTIEFLHTSNTTNAITYKLMGYVAYGDFILNRGWTLDSSARSSGTSTLTLTEVAA